MPSDTIALSDSTLLDSMALMTPDTMVVRGGVMPIIEEKYIDAQLFQKEDTLKEKKVKVDRPFSKLAEERSPIFKDTLSFNKTIIFSTLAPGFGQLYNNQYWKIPVVYGTVGGLLTGAILTTPNYKASKSLYEEASTSGASTDVTTYRYYNMSRYKTQRNLLFAAAGATYIYSICDAAINYKGDIHPTRKATVLSAIMPGAGQVYNQKYWKLPIVYGGFATFAYIITYNNRGYQRFKLAYQYRTDDNDKTVDIYNGYVSDSQLQNTRNSFRRYRDLGIIMLGGFYLLQIIDAHVDAYLDMYDVSDDLSLQIEPFYSPTPYVSKGGEKGGGVFGVGMKFKF